MRPVVRSNAALDARTTTLLTQNSPELLRYFRRRARPEEDAADLLAELCLTVWRTRARVPHLDEEARMWLYGVAHNTLRNWARGRRRHDERTQRLREEVRTHAAPPDLDEVRGAIDRLPPDQSELVRLIHWEGFSVVEAARIIGTSESTARGRYQRARGNLAKDPQIAALRGTASAERARRTPTVAE